MVGPPFLVQGVPQQRKTLADPVIAVILGSLIAAITCAGGGGGNHFPML